MIYFPVIRKFTIDKYQLYKNDNNSGITHDLFGGIHLIVGINGLGKTTLLNAIYRLLVGGNDTSKGDDKALGTSQHKLSAWRHRRFFSKRVKDKALNATIEAEIEFGENTLLVTRKLSNLEVTFLSENGKELQASQQVYEERVVKLSGLSDFVDFFSVVKHLLFFLEDRAELIWNYGSQFEMFRILFFDNEASVQAAEFKDEAQSADSNYRNLYDALKGTREEFESITQANNSDLKTELAVSEAHLAGLEQSQEIASQDLLECRHEIENTKYQIAVAKREYDEFRLSSEQLQHELFSNYFPDLDNTIKFLFSNLSSGGGCFACGNKSYDAGKKVRQALEKRDCPVCEAKIEEQETAPNVTKEFELDERRLDKVKIRIAETQKTLENLEEFLSEKYVDENNLLGQLVELSQERLTLEKRIQKIRKSLPPEDADLESLSRQLKLKEGELAALDRKRIQKDKAFRDIVRSQQNKIDSNMRKVKEKFQYYSKQLLAEEVFLEITTFKNKIGQRGDSLSFPCFKVYMTSGVFDTNPAPREDPEDVSESQREFIDLAFRLSLIDVVSGVNAPAMMVMETPEASLDSMFMHEISRLFRDFANMNNGKNILLASTNLNQSQMISSLLGAVNSPEATFRTRKEEILGDTGTRIEAPIPLKIKPAERTKHIINLLELASPNATLKNHALRYQQLFEEAVYPEGEDTGIADE